ncbi:hypothetical protein THERMOT_1128 [Bathymodiolus thermophilus thioautotrophic gill symbiont]|nr:hypothetical protein THERMOT_1128 [Bathymodiolus thermophilus thioautotrophic gill symbiont]
MSKLFGLVPMWCQILTKSVMNRGLELRPLRLSNCFHPVQIQTWCQR